MRLLSRLRAAGAQALNDLVRAHEGQLSSPPARLPLLDFAGDAAIARWLLHTDKGVGGFSECQLEALSPASALWSGVTALEADTTVQTAQVNDQGKVASKTGFVAMRTRVADEAWALHDFHGLCVRMRPDARKYVLNVRADNVLGDDRTDDLYQVTMCPFLEEAVASGASAGDAPAPPEPEQQQPMVDVRIPWGAFTLTWRGYVQGVRPPAMHLDRITHVGFLLSDGEDGPFACEMGALSAFRYEDEELKHSAHARAAMRLNAERGYEDVLS